MTEAIERRREKRLRYSWPIWFAEDYNGILSQGQMVDVCSGGAAFTCYADKCPTAGGHITARFSIPRYDNENSFDMENFIRGGHICRVDELSPFVRRVAIQFSESLPFRPAVSGDTEDVTADETIKSDEMLESVADITRAEALAMAETLEPVVQIDYTNTKETEKV